MALLASMPVGLVPRAAQADPAGSHPGLRLVGYSDLGGAGLNGPVAVVGNTAVVAAGINPGGGVHTGFYNPYPCPATTVKLVDLTRPDSPTVVGAIPVAAGISALDVAALHVENDSFEGNLAAVALAACGPGAGAVDRGVAYYDITDARKPSFLGRYAADSEGFTPGKTCGAPSATTDPGSCASSQHSVSLHQRPDGRVLSLSTEPFATASGFPSGDLRVVDVTNPRQPVQLGSFPGSGSGFSHNGCRPFSAGHDATFAGTGDRALLAYLDQGLMDVSLSSPAAPSLLGQANPYPTSGPDARRTEGNGGHVAVGGAHQNLGLLSDEDWIAPTTTLRVDSPASSAQGLTAGSFFGCEAMFTLFDPHDTAQIYRHQGSQVPAGPSGSSGAIVYLGRGCPVNKDFGTVTPDPYLVDASGNPVDPHGKIAVVDRFTTSLQRGTRVNPGPPPATVVEPTSQIRNGGPGCSISEKARRAQENGAIGVVIDATFGTDAFSPDGDPAGLRIPVMALDKPGSTQLRTTLCPGVTPAFSGHCSAGTAVTGAMVDSPGGTRSDPGGWGGLRVIDLAGHVQVGAFKTSRSLAFPPPDLGVYAPGHAESSGNLAYVSWNSDGLRVLDLSDPSRPTEVGHFVPGDHPDPTGVIPGKTYVVGVALVQSDDGSSRSGHDGPLVVITDINSGLYVLTTGESGQRGVDAPSGHTG